MAGFSQSRMAARLQNLVSYRRMEAGLYAEIAEQLPLAGCDRLLDVGTGSGLQLRAIRELWPGPEDIELHGLDVSAAALAIAGANLAGFDVHLRQGSIAEPPYDKDYFDVVTCHSSMSYWQDPTSCFDQIHWILRPGGAAILFEPQKDLDLDEVVAIIDDNLAGKSRLRRFAARNLNRYGLRCGRTLGLRLYSLGELEEIIRASRFGPNHALERTSLQNLPIFVRITLHKTWGHDRPVGQGS
jgi:SAM-dependent methyltransferase